MEKLNKVLKAQIAKTVEFQSTQNKPVGEGFEDMVKEVLRSDTVSMNLVGAVLEMGKYFPGVLIARAQFDGTPGTVQDIIHKNLGAFQLYLAMLYWGIAIGKMQAEEEAKTLKGIESLESIISDKHVCGACIGQNGEHSCGLEVELEQVQKKSQESAWKLELEQELSKFSKNTLAGEKEIQDIEGGQI